jgi:hypothetical protein
MSSCVLVLYKSLLYIPIAGDDGNRLGDELPDTYVQVNHHRIPYDGGAGVGVSSTSPRHNIPRIPTQKHRGRARSHWITIYTRNYSINTAAKHEYRRSKIHIIIEEISNRYRR